jgi:hypothetical protein
MIRLARAGRGPALALAALALGACATVPGGSPARPEAAPAIDVQAVLAGCTAGQLDRISWRVHCGGLVAEVRDPYGEPEAELLRAGLARLALVGGGTPREAPAQLRVGGALHAATRAELRSVAVPSKVRATGVALTVPIGEEQVRLAWCVAQPSVPAARCDQVAAALASLPWRAGPPPAGALPPELAGRPVLVPPGCEATRDPLGGDISCSASDGWRWRRAGVPKDVAPSDLDYVDSQAEAEAAAKAAPTSLLIPEPPADGAPCLVDGVETRCAVKEGWGGASVTATTVATVRGLPLELTCTWFGATDELPAVCDGLELKP